MRFQRRTLEPGVLRCAWVAVVSSAVFLAVVGVSILILVAGARVTRGETDAAEPGNDAPAVVSPGHRIVLADDEVTLICRADDARLSIDGAAGRWEPFSPPLRVSRLKLTPGAHTIQAGGRTLDVFVVSGKNGAKPPEGWDTCGSHPMPDESGSARCAACHVIEQDDDNRAIVVELKSYKACFECHRPVDFEVDHAHILEPLEACQMCHALHGSKHASLLKAPMRQLCAECHDPDH